MNTSVAPRAACSSIEQVDDRRLHRDVQRRDRLVRDDDRRLARQRPGRPRPAASGRPRAAGASRDRQLGREASTTSSSRRDLGPDRAASTAGERLSRRTARPTARSPPCGWGSASPRGSGRPSGASCRSAVPGRCLDRHHTRRCGAVEGDRPRRRLSAVSSPETTLAPGSTCRTPTRPRWRASARAARPQRSPVVEGSAPSGAWPSEPGRPRGGRPRIRRTFLRVADLKDAASGRDRALCRPPSAPARL